MFAKALLRGRFLFLLSSPIVLLLSGCLATTGQLGAIEDAWKLASASTKVDTSKLPKRYEYLLIYAGGKPAIMGLGKRTQTSTPQGEVVDEFWFSTQGEMMIMRNGRIHTVFGMPPEWRNNQSSPPTWQQTLSAPQAISWLRVRDEMPNYRYGISDKIVTTALASPPPLDKIASELVPTQNPQIKWVQDSVETSNDKGQRWAFTQVFAIDQNQVVYSEQCISPVYCLQIQRVKR
jgi:hypothetical protein